MFKRVKSVVSAIVVAGIAFLILGRVGWFECHYYNDATVTDINGNNIVVTDNNNYEWIFIGKDFVLNDKVRLTMYNNHTDLNILDDEIEAVTKVKK